MEKLLPGTPAQQQILQTILDFYAADDRIRAVVVFGSLGRGNWDAYSDLDLDITTNDIAPLDVALELARLCDFIKARHGVDALIIPKTDEGDVVLSNLIEFSIRYHPLHDTKAAIVDTMTVLAGTLSAEEIQTAGEANRRDEQPDPAIVINQCIRYTLELHNALMRQRWWMCMELLHRIRTLLMILHAIPHGEIRAVQFFDSTAAPGLHERLQHTVAQPEAASIKAALEAVLHLLDHDIGDFSAGHYRLSDPQRAVLQRIGERVSASG